MKLAECEYNIRQSNAPAVTQTPRRVAPILNPKGRLKRMKNNTSDGHVYFISMVGTQFIKIGHSFDPERRLKQLQTASPVALKLIGIRPGSKHVERLFHRQLREFRQEGEWFEIVSRKAVMLIELLCSEHWDSSITTSLIDALKIEIDYDLWATRPQPDHRRYLPVDESGRTIIRGLLPKRRKQSPQYNQ